MPKKTKIGKDRKDKFYKLAKETGKIVEITRKHQITHKIHFRISFTCCFQVNPTKSSLWLSRSVTSMCRSVCCTWRLDASCQTKHASLEHRYWHWSVSHQTNSRLYCTHRRHHHRKVPSGSDEGAEDVESWRFSQRWRAKCWPKLAVWCISADLLIARCSEVGNWVPQTWRLVHHESFPIKGLQCFRVGAQTVFQESLCDQTVGIA